MIGSYTLVPNPFWGGALFPLIVFGVPRTSGRGSSGGSRGDHGVPQPARPAARRAVAHGDRRSRWSRGSCSCSSPARRTASTSSSASRTAAQIWFYRVLVFVGPAVAGFVAYRVCRELKAGELVEPDRRLAEAEARLARARAEP